jgi:hypothetical protein
MLKNLRLSLPFTESDDSFPYSQQPSWECILNQMSPLMPQQQTRTNSVALVRERTIPTVRPPLVGEVSAKCLRIEGCRMVSAADPYGCNLDFLDRSRYFFFQVAPQSN